MRWADMDMLGHVNNVTYVDSLQEARIGMLAAHAPARGSEELADGVVVVRHEVQFRSPLPWRLEPVKVESWVSELRAATFTMAYEIYDEGDDDERRVYVRATTLLTPYVFAEERPRRISPVEREALQAVLEPGFDKSPRVPAAPEPGPRHTLPMWVRWSDVDAYGHVNNVKYFEYFQEARIRYLMRIFDVTGPGERAVPLVIAQMDVDYRVPILFRPEPYDVHSWVSSVGNSSFVIESEIRDGETLLSRARVVAVMFDAATQKASPAPAAHRAALMTELTRTS